MTVLSITKDRHICVPRDHNSLQAACEKLQVSVTVKWFLILLSNQGHVVKPGLDWTCKTWTGLICKTWTGLRTIQFVKHGLDSFVKPGLDSFVKHGLDSFVKHGLDSFVKHGLVFSSIDELIDIFFYSI